MTRWQWGSLTVLISCLVLMGVWDAIAIYHVGRKGSISYLITMGTYHVPIVAFLFGVLAGHLFWSVSTYQQDVAEATVIQITVDKNGNTLKVQQLPLERDNR